MSGTERNPSPDWREERRLRAWELHQQGLSQRRIAAELGVTQGAVCQWLKKAREGGGVNALYNHPAPGRRAALTAIHLEQLPGLLAAGASAYGYESDQWTTKRVAGVISQVFGVSHHPAHISRLLSRHYPDWNKDKPHRKHR